MRRLFRSDLNQGDIVKALRKVGCCVFVAGQPVDLIVFSPRTQITYLVEVKREDKKVTYTEAQKKFRATWRGPWYTVRSVAEALELVR